MRFLALYYFMASVVISTVPVRCALDSDLSDSLFFLPDDDDGTMTNDLFSSGGFDELTTATIPANGEEEEEEEDGDGDVDFLDDGSDNEIPLDFGSSLAPPSGGDGIAYDGGGDASSCARPLGKRDVSDEDLILVGG